MCDKGCVDAELRTSPPKKALFSGVMLGVTGYIPVT